MKRISLLALSLVLVSMMAIPAFAQGGAQPGTAKIGWLNTGMFDEPKDGVKKYVAAVNALELEMKPRFLELQTIATRIGTINEDLKKMGGNPAVPVDQRAYAAKQEEGQRLQREGEFKQKEYDATLQKRRDAILGPIMEDIGKALQEYGKNKGYSVILDVNKLYEAGVLLSFDPAADITKDFITFFNARPATTAAKTAPPPVKQ